MIKAIIALGIWKNIPNKVILRRYELCKPTVFLDIWKASRRGTGTQTAVLQTCFSATHILSFQRAL